MNIFSFFTFAGFVPFFVVLLWIFKYSSGQKYEQQQSANPETCEVGPWSSWGEINCITEQRTRTREINKEGTLRCTVALTDVKYVRIPSPIVTAWSEWGHPDSNGTRRRWRTINGICADIKLGPDFPLEETKSEIKLGDEKKQNQNSKITNAYNDIPVHSTQVSNHKQNLTIEPFVPIKINFSDSKTTPSTVNEETSPSTDSVNKSHKSTEPSKIIPDKIVESPKRKMLIEPFVPLSLNLSSPVNLSIEDTNKTSSLPVITDIKDESPFVIMHSRVAQTTRNFDSRNENEKRNGDQNVDILPADDNHAHFEMKSNEKDLGNNESTSTPQNNDDSKDSFRNVISKAIQVIIQSKDDDFPSSSTHIQTAPLSVHHNKPGVYRKLFIQHVKPINQYYKLPSYKIHRNVLPHILEGTYLKSEIMDDDSAVISTTPRPIPTTPKRSFWKSNSGWFGLPLQSRGSQNTPVLYDGPGGFVGNQMTNIDRSYGNQLPSFDGSYGSQLPRFDGSYGSQLPSSDGSYGSQIPSSAGSYGSQIPSSAGSYGSQIPSSAGSYGSQIPSSDGSYGSQLPSFDGSYGSQLPSSDGSYGSQLSSSDGSYGSQIPSSAGSYGSQLPSLHGSYGSQLPSSDGAYGSQLPSFDGSYGSSESLAVGPAVSHNLYATHSNTDTPGNHNTISNIQHNNQNAPHTLWPGSSHFIAAQSRVVYPAAAGQSRDNNRHRASGNSGQLSNEDLGDFKSADSFATNNMFHNNLTVLDSHNKTSLINNPSADSNKFVGENWNFGLDFPSSRLSENSNFLDFDRNSNIDHFNSGKDFSDIFSLLGTNNHNSKETGSGESHDSFYDFVDPFTNLNLTMWRSV